MARILAISSQVARGHVGLSAIVPALQALGHDCVALPTVLLSNHPGHPHVAGERIAPDLLRRMLDALDANGWLGAVDGIITGYLPSVEHVAFAAEAVQRLRRTRPDLLYLCDPVLGDEPKGLYISRDAAEAICDRLVPLAHVVKMNRFECGWLAGEPVVSSADASRLAQARGWSAAIVTSIPEANGVPAEDGSAFANVLLEPGAPPVKVCVMRRTRVPNGAGDLFGALYLGYRLRDGTTPEQALRRAVTDVEFVIRRSVDADELQLVAGLRELGQ